jgi:hypothetical protein
MHNQQVTGIEQGTFTPLIFTTTGGMGEECEKYHSQLAELGYISPLGDFINLNDKCKFRN